ncbi:MAG: rhodanese-like domain-containing protein [Gammaproteobacteria bacterium]|nr:rhodanese-like domain-containing protein [Gammaproteobacteria bacterium]
MEKIPEFLINHWDLSLSLVIILAMLFGGGLFRKLRGYTEVDTADAVLMINHQQALVVDVREESEVKEGAILNALHIPLGELNSRIAEVEAHRERPLIVVCRSGNRSGSACARLAKAGLTPVSNLKGGMMAWKNAGLPVNKVESRSDKRRKNRKK